MTSVDLAALQVPPAGGTGSGNRRLGSNEGFEEADAGFLAQLAMVAAEEGTGACVCVPSEAGEAAIARWWQQQAGGEALPALPPEARDGAIDVIPAGDLIDAGVAGMALPAAPPADVATGVVPEPHSGDLRRRPAQAKDPPASVDSALLALAAAPPIMPPAVSSSATTPSPILPSAPADPQQAALPPETSQPVAKLQSVAKHMPSPSELPVVTVVRTETHHAPVAPATAIVAAPPASRPVPAPSPGAVDDRKSDRPREIARPVPSNPTPQRGAGHALAQVAAASADQAEGDALLADANGESATPLAPLASRGVAEAGPPAGMPAQQVAEKIVASLVSQEPESSPAVLAPALRPGASYPVKVLTIQLHPAHLGTVIVRMTLKADAMDVEVEAGRPATARLIDADREALTGLLRSAGYHVEGLTIRAVDQASPAAPSTGGMPGSADAGPQLQAGVSQGDARPSGGRAQPEPRSHTQASERNDNDGEQTAGGRHGAGLYV